MVFGTANLVQTRTINKANEITGITNTTGGAWGTPTYDLVGNTTKTPSVEAPTDASKDRQLTYDAWNRVVRVTDSDTSGFDPNRIAFYEYDARGFRITNQRYPGSGTGADWLTHYYYTSGWQCVEERVVDLTITPEPTAQLSVQYVWGLRYVDDLIQRQRDTTGNGTLDETLYAISDRQFNIVALTDTSQAVVQRMSYTPYGEVKFLTSSYGASTNTKGWEQLFQGLRLDQTSLYDNRRRILDALTGRFVQNDLLEYVDGMNRYAAYHVMHGQVDSLGLQRGDEPYAKITVSVGISIFKVRKVFDDLELADFENTFELSCDSEGKVVFKHTPQARIVNTWQEIRAALDLKQSGKIGINHTGKHSAVISWTDNQIMQGDEYFNELLGTASLIVSGVAHKSKHPKVALAALATSALSWIGDQLDDVFFYQIDAYWKAECKCIEGRWGDWWAISIKEDKPTIININSNIKLRHNVWTLVSPKRR